MKFTKEEQETDIIISADSNDASVYTRNPVDIRKLYKCINDKKYKNTYKLVHEYKDEDGTYALEVKAPKNLVYGFHAPREKREMSEEEKELHKQALAKARQNKTH